jgi:hypothetical protein
MHMPDNKQFILKQGPDRGQALAYERILAEGLKTFLQEMVMIDGGVMVGYVCNGQHANLGDIIGSSSETAMKPGRLRYCNDARLDFDWGERPAVTLAMELADERLTASFRIVFGGDHVGVDVRGVQFAEAISGPDEALRRFAAAVDDARLPRAA